MRKTSVRKFIHMVIDILPLLIIPIFALNILHKETEPISIEVQEKVSVDFNQTAYGHDTFVPWSSANLSVSNTSTSSTATLLTNTQSSTYYYAITVPIEQTVLNHKYLITYQVYSESITWFGFDTVGGYRTINNLPLDTINIIDTIWNANVSSNTLLLRPFGVLNTNDSYTVYKTQMYDLTEMGFEDITPNEFYSMFPDTYPYIESQKILVNKPSPTTYNSTDIGSQFIYALYKPVNDYFNFNNLFNMGAIYNWIELNLFSGTAPLPIFIIWNVIVYEFFVDLIFLLYGVFMFIIDFAEKCLERPFRR